MLLAAALVMFMVAGCSTSSDPIPGSNDYTSANIGTLKYVPAGSFQRDDGPLNISTISKAFRMSQYEITRNQFLAIMGVDPSDESSSTGMTDPVQMVNWYHAIAFCNKLSIAEHLTPVYSVGGVDFTTLAYAQIPTTLDDEYWNAAFADWTADGYRLPTEMEWMWAAMGATSDSIISDIDILTGINTGGYAKPFAGYNGSNLIGDYTWYSIAGDGTGENSYGTTHPGGTTGHANELGLYDMSGNAWEWCWDWWDTYPDGPLLDYKGSNRIQFRILSGGSWFLDASYAAVAYHYGSDRPSYLDKYYGFRVVRN